MNSNATSAPDLGDCIGLVRSLAWGLAPKVPDHIHIDDLVGEGYVGLVEAMKLFNPERQVLFTTYAYPRVRGAMIDYVHRECRGGLHRNCRLPEWLPASTRSPEYEATVRERVEHVLDRWTHLPWRRRRIVEGLAQERDFKDIAEDLSISIWNLHKLKRLARAALRKPRLPPMAVSNPHIEVQS